MARIPYPERLPDVVSRLPVPLNVFKMLSHAPNLVGPTADLGLILLTGSSLSPSTRELVIMAVAAETECAYMAVQHTPIALDAGVTRTQLDAISAGHHGGEYFDEAEISALTVASSLLLSRTIEIDVFEAARIRYPERQLTELIMLVGYYVMVAGLLNGTAVDIDPWKEVDAQPSSGD
ncbi:carboxymuconolactone decarboxylase family protein [Streptomyces sp. NPDC088789]|uniref:carboxymuconolactone decarboxylase family protein n=1 Tax=Streptomyces sp. NPDC088789 TaxID=3365899 RepID=UPI003814BAC7